MPPPLYPSEDQLAELLLGQRRKGRWKDVAPVLERGGLPPVDPLMQGRYWPAVRRWLDRRHHVDTIPSSPSDETENWHE